MFCNFALRLHADGQHLDGDAGVGYALQQGGFTVQWLRSVAATPPQEPVPKITPPEIAEEKTVLENVTDISRHYGDALSTRFAQLYRNLRYVGKVVLLEE